MMASDKTSGVRGRAARIALAVPLAAVLAVLPPAAVCAPASADDVQATEEEYVQVKPGYLDASKGYTELNKFRKSHGRKKLKKNKRLVKTAKIRAKELAKRYSHTRPNGKRCFTAYPKSSKRAENIAWGQEDGYWAVKKWESTSGHRKNMLRKNVNAVGMAGYRGADGVYYWVQCLAKL